MLTATCHCGAVRVSVPGKPLTVADCNCSICRRYGVLWAYYPASTVQIESGPTHGYAWGRKDLRFVRCANCGCLMYWERVTPQPEKKMGVNARNFPPEIVESATVELLDGAAD